MKKAIRIWFRRQVTLYRLSVLLKYGWCPKCNSSPPNPVCPVCYGSYNYGPKISYRNRGRWAERWIHLRG